MYGDHRAHPFLLFAPLSSERRGGSFWEKARVVLTTKRRVDQKGGGGGGGHEFDWMKRSTTSFTEPILRKKQGESKLNGRKKGSKVQIFGSTI